MQATGSLNSRGTQPMRWIAGDRKSQYPFIFGQTKNILQLVSPFANLFESRVYLPDDKGAENNVTVFARVCRFHNKYGLVLGRPLSDWEAGSSNPGQDKHTSGIPCDIKFSARAS